MKKQGCWVVLLCAFLQGCLSGVWTGANLVYDRHSLYKKASDINLAFQANQLLFQDRILKQQGCSLHLAVFNEDILLTGHVPTQELRKLALQRIAKLGGYRELFKQIAVSTAPANSALDTWISTKIRGKIIADSSLEPADFKIVTADQVVYIMGDAKLEEARKVLALASETDGVKRVVKLLRYYTLNK